MNSTNRFQTLQNKLIKHIMKLSFKSNYNENTKNKLEKLYNELHSVNHVIEKITGYSQYEFLFNLQQTIPIFFTTNAKPIKHELNDSVFSNIINPKPFYTEEEAICLIKWTVNNTNNNLLINSKKENYNSDDLMGTCCFSQFSSLYPLQKLGLKITINNVSSFCPKHSHAFGTVTIPIIINNQIIEKQYLIDCTYNQFLHLDRCVQNMYLDYNYPDPGYFIKQNKNISKTIDELVTNGYIELSKDNAQNYAYGFYLSSVRKEQIKLSIEKIKEVDLISIINNVQEPFDYDYEEFNDYGYNLDIQNIHYIK